MQDLYRVVMGVLVGPAAAAAADVLKVFSVSSRAARLVMSKVVGTTKTLSVPRRPLVSPEGFHVSQCVGLLRVHALVGAPGRRTCLGTSGRSSRRH